MIRLNSLLASFELLGGASEWLVVEYARKSTLISIVPSRFLAVAYAGQTGFRAN